ncbi:MAG: PEP-CTERM sorting domain-containing protein [Opitutaceae bacterium]|jgi:hypothetical protein|nr:PEP-CTERM sorting domain-containing protein [Opitutaceae bacterium]
MKDKLQKTCLRAPGLRAAALLNAAIVSLASAAAATAASTTLLQDSFDDGDRAGWFSASSNASSCTLDNDAGTLTIGPERHIVTYFEATTLAIGDSLTVSFDVSFNNPKSYSNGIRMALYDSHSTAETSNRVAADGHGSGNDLFKPYTGYRADMSFTAYTGTTNAIYIRHRNPADATHTGNSLLHSNTGMYYENIEGGGGSSATPTDAALYTGVFTITRLATGTKILVSLVGTGLTNYSFEAEDTNGYSTFDTFAILLPTSNAMDTLTLHDVTITHAAAVPEPATAAAMLGVLTAALAAVILTLRRRQR